MDGSATTPTGSCDRVRMAVSAQLDDEDSGLPAGEVTTHVARCGDCAHHVELLARVDRDLRLQPAPAVPDLTAGIVTAVAEDRAAARLRQRRGVIALTGVAMVVLAIVALATSGLVHTGREVAMFEVATGVALVGAAWRPRRLAGGVFPVVATFSLLIVSTSVIDIMAGLTSIVAETVHLAPIMAAALLWPWVAASHRPDVATVSS